MEKPTQQAYMAYDWNKVERFIEAKYGVDLRKYKNTSPEDDHDFWWWLVNTACVERHKFFTLPEDGFEKGGWQDEILTLIRTEFPDVAKRAKFFADW